MLIHSEQMCKVTTADKLLFICQICAHLCEAKILALIAGDIPGISKVVFYDFILFLAVVEKCEESIYSLVDSWMFSFVWSFHLLQVLMVALSKNLTFKGGGESRHQILDTGRGLNLKHQLLTVEPGVPSLGCRF